MEFLPDSGHAVPGELGETMSRRPRRNHTPAFKAKVAQGGSKTWLSLLSSSTCTPIRSPRGKRSSRAGLPMFFGPGFNGAAQPAVDVKSLHASRRADAGERFFGRSARAAATYAAERRLWVGNVPRWRLLPLILIRA